MSIGLIPINLGENSGRSFQSPLVIFSLLTLLGTVKIPQESSLPLPPRGLSL